MGIYKVWHRSLQQCTLSPAKLKASKIHKRRNQSIMKNISESLSTRTKTPEKVTSAVSFLTVKSHRLGWSVLKTWAFAYLKSATHWSIWWSHARPVNKQASCSSRWNRYTMFYSLSLHRAWWEFCSRIRDLTSATNCQLGFLWYSDRLPAVRKTLAHSRTATFRLGWALKKITTGTSAKSSISVNHSKELTTSVFS